ARSHRQPHVRRATRFAKTMIAQDLDVGVAYVTGIYRGSAPNLYNRGQSLAFSDRLSSVGLAVDYAAMLSLRPSVYLGAELGAGAWLGGGQITYGAHQKRNVHPDHDRDRDERQLVLDRHGIDGALARFSRWRSSPVTSFTRPSVCSFLSPISAPTRFLILPPSSWIAPSERSAAFA